jgi:hypothetical protein
LRRAGVLKKMLCTVTVVPGGPGAGRGSLTRSPSTSIRPASSAPVGRETTDMRLTDASDARASPRKPRVPIASRSSVVLILLVACGATARASSANAMPQPSSVTRTRSRPPFSIATSMREAPASSAFSTSSFTTLAGRSTTSPAAIWFLTSGGRTWMATRSL